LGDILGEFLSSLGEILLKPSGHTELAICFWTIQTNI